MKVYNMNLGELGASFALSSDGDYFNECVAVGAEAPAGSRVVMPDSKDISAKLQEALLKLDPELRAVLESKYGIGCSSECDCGAEGFTDSAVAERLGSTVDTVAALEELALRSLFTPVKKAS